MAELTWDASSPNDLSINDITLNAVNYRIVVIDTTTDTPKFLPLSVLASKFVIKSGDTMTGALTVNGNLATTGSLTINNSNHPVVLTTGARTANPDEANISENYLSISAGLEVSGYSYFKKFSIYPSSSAPSFSNFPNYHYGLIGSGASQLAADQVKLKLVFRGDNENNPNTESLLSGNSLLIRKLAYAWDDIEHRIGFKMGVGYEAFNTTSMTRYKPYMYFDHQHQGHRLLYPASESSPHNGELYIKAGAASYFPTHDPSALPSDDRLKTRVLYSSHSLDELVSIPAFEFYYNDDATKQLRLGTSAQSVRNVEPLIVHGNESNDEYLSLEYDKLGLLALEGIKLLKKENDNLKEELNELKQLINQLINK